MITISILTLRNAVLSSVSDTSYLFAKVNDFLKSSGKEPLFRVQLVGLEQTKRCRTVPLRCGRR
jgi:hypothetical protein